MKLYFKYLKLHVKSDMQYKMSFIISLISQIFIFFTYYFAIIALFNKFDNIKGFTVYEILLAFSIIQIGFAFNETFGRGIDKFDTLIIKGEYDRILLKPRSILLQILGYEIDITRIIKIVQGIIILVIAITNLNIYMNPLKVITLILMIISSIILFFGIFLISAAYCFITVQGLEVRNLLTDGGKEMAQYPISIYTKSFKFIFTFIIPYGFINYYPLLYVIGKTDNILYMLSPLVIFLFLIPSVLIFKKLSKRYISTGS